MLNHTPDIEVRFQFNGTRKTPAKDGYFPAHFIREGCIIGGVHHYFGVDFVAPDGCAEGTITFIMPESIPHSLHVGMELPIMEGARVMGLATILKILNPLLQE